MGRPSGWYRLDLLREGDDWEPSRAQHSVDTTRTGKWTNHYSTWCPLPLLSRFSTACRWGLMPSTWTCLLASVSYLRVPGVVWGWSLCDAPRVDSAVKYNLEGQSLVPDSVCVSEFWGSGWGDSRAKASTRDRSVFKTYLGQRRDRTQKRTNSIGSVVTSGQQQMPDAAWCNPQ